MADKSVTEIRETLKTIADDMAQDAKTFDGQPFTGRTVGQYLGNHGAAIAALANIVATLLPPESEPVPASQRFPSAEELRPYIGQFVAIKDGAVIFSADSATALVRGLPEGMTPDSAFRVTGSDEVPS